MLSNRIAEFMTLAKPGRSWPCRRDPDFADPDPWVVSIGDTVHEWTVADSNTELHTDYSACHGDNGDGPSGWPRWCVPVFNKHVPACIKVEHTMIRFTLVCSCGTVKKTYDPFQSRKCLHHGANMYAIQQFFRSMLEAAA